MQTSTPVPITMRRVIYYKGAVVSDTGDVTQTNGYAFQESTANRPKSGTFTPGVYRVTAMSASRSSQQAAGSGNYVRTYKVGGYIYRYTHKGPFSSVCGGVNSYPRFTYVDFLSDGDVALTAAFAKLGKPKFELGVEFGEMKETLQFLRSPLSSLRRYLLSDRRRNLRLLGQVIRGRHTPGKFLRLSGKTVSDTWLELRYALRPLIYSIAELVELNVRQRKLDPNRIRTVGKSLKSHRSRSGTFQSGTTYDLKVTGPTKTDADAIIRARVYYRQTADLSLSQKLGTDLANIPEIFWELTRCSFIADWFANLGSYISSFRITPQIQVLGSTVSYRITEKHSATPSKAWLLDGWTCVEENLGTPTTAQTESYQRLVKDAFPPGLPHFRSIPNLDFPKLVDLLLITMQGISLRK